DVHYAAVATPALLLDRKILLDNITRISQRATCAGVALWPHAKTHKSSKVARLQLAHGAAGLTVATVREAALFADAGFEHLLVASPPGGAQRLEALVQLASRVNVRVVLDDVLTVEMLHAAARKS